MNKIVITGHKTTIAKNFKSKALLKNSLIYEIRTREIDDHLDADKYVFCHGVMYPKKSYELTDAEKENSMYTNFISVVEMCDKIIDHNDKARICVISSYSAFVGSYDDTYALSKALLNQYIERKVLRTPKQQLVGIAPSAIEDSGMTQRRKDLENLNKKRENHPMKRLVQSYEVSRLIYTLLYEQPYINRTVIQMHGGNV